MGVRLRTLSMAALLVDLDPSFGGHYLVFSRAIDVQGITEESFSRHDRNRYALRVVGSHRP
jgi:hypothetical protein